jgi:Ser/Thr protein kinase RdoA (MazF antagonist)
MEMIPMIAQRDYGLGVNSTEIIQKGYENDVCLLKCNGGKKLVLRISKNNDKLSGDFLYEAEIIEQLRSSKLPVPSMLKTLDGRPVAEIDGRPAVLFEFMEGKRVLLDVENTPAPGTIEAAGGLLAKIHRALDEKCFGPKNKTSRNIFSEFNKLISKESLIQQSFSNGDELINDCKRYYDFGKSNFRENCIIHGDYRAQNLLARDDGSISAILDFDWCCPGPAEKDLALALVEWSFPDRAPSYRKDVFDLFLRGYENEMKAPLDRKIMKNWICFACLSDAATYVSGLVDGLEEMEENKEIKCYMYKKFRFFENVDF